MKFAGRSNRLTAWIAIFAILLAALAPSIARALPRQQSAEPWKEICTLGGTKATQEPGSDSGQGMPVKHCPLCLMHAISVVLPATPPDYLPILDPGVGVFIQAEVLSPPHFTVTATQPRGPPTTS